MTPPPAPANLWPDLAGDIPLAGGGGMIRQITDGVNKTLRIVGTSTKASTTTVATITLPAGKYTFTGCPTSPLDAYAVIRVNGNIIGKPADANALIVEETFTLSASTEVDCCLVIAADGPQQWSDAVAQAFIFAAA